MRRFAPLLPLLAACAEDPPAGPEGSLPLPGPAPAPAVLVVNTSETLSRLDLDTGEMTAWAATLGTWANRVRASADGRTLLVTASGDNEVQLLGAVDLAPLGGIDLGPGSNPWIAVPVAAGTAIVTSWVSGDVRRLDLARGVAGPAVDTTPGPEGMAVSGGRAWVACTNWKNDAFGEGRLDVVDLSAWRVLASIPVGRNPQDVAVAPDGRVHVVCTGTYGGGPTPEDGTVVVIDPVALSPVGTVDLGGSPGRIAIDGNGTAWIAGFSGGLRRYDTASLEIAPDPTDPALRAPSLSAVTVDSATGRAYVTNFDLDALIAVDATTTEVADVWPVGDGPVDAWVLRPEER